MGRPQVMNVRPMLIVHIVLSRRTRTRTQYYHCPRHIFLFSSSEDDLLLYSVVYVMYTSGCPVWFKTQLLTATYRMRPPINFQLNAKRGNIDSQKITGKNTHTHISEATKKKPSEKSTPKNNDERRMKWKQTTRPEQSDMNEIIIIMIAKHCQQSV